VVGPETGTGDLISAVSVQSRNFVAIPGLVTGNTIIAGISEVQCNPRGEYQICRIRISKGIVGAVIFEVKSAVAVVAGITGYCIVAAEGTLSRSCIYKLDKACTSMTLCTPDPVFGKAY
jgi:hypothetical protein